MPNAHGVQNGEDYIDVSLDLDIQEVRNVQELIEKRLLTVFVDFFQPHAQGGEWAYEVVDYRENRQVPVGRYSVSTNAMILFALAAIFGRASSNPLSRNLPRSPRPLARDIGRTIYRAVRNLIYELRGGNTRSSTFGRNDPLTLTWVLQVLPAWTSDAASTLPAAIRHRSERLQRRFREISRGLIDDAIANPRGPHLLFPSRSDGTMSSPLEHVFPLLRIVHLQAVLRTESRRGPWFLSRYFTDRLHTQLAYSDGEDPRFEVAELVFSLEGALLSQPDSLSTDLIERVFDILRRQSYWRATKPTVVTPRGHIHVPISVEIANSLLRICQQLRPPGSYFSRNVDLFKQYSRWLLGRLVSGEAPGRRGRGTRRPFAGWQSEHTDAPGSIHLWYTSQAMLYLSDYSKALQRHMAAAALQSAGLFVSSQSEGNDYASPDADKWRISTVKYEPALGVGSSTYYRPYTRIGDMYVNRRLPANGTTAPPGHYSMLLFGPPGTGKTTIAEELAAALNFRFVVISPSDFIQRGEAEIELRAKRIFKALQVQAETVILFDEIDRMILDRDSRLYQTQSDVFQFMTPGMLTKFRDLRKHQKPLVVVATNYAERIDRAIKRRGRIDDQYLVVPPARRRRAIILTELMERYAPQLFRNMPGVRLRRLTAPIVRATALFSVPELDGLVERAAEDFLQDPDVGAVAFCGQLTALAEEARPTINIEAYAERFRLRRQQEYKFPTVEEPLEEFLLVVYLLLEVGTPLTERERRIVRRIVLRRKRPPRPLAEIAERIRIVHDDAIRARLLRTFERWFT
jgi:adenylate kinase family enzyme